MKLDACSGKLSAKRVPRTPSLSLRPVGPRRGPTRSNTKPGGLREDNDARTGMPFGMPKGAMCVQRFDDSRKFCNSHYLSHFAAFFIDARTKRSVVESFVFDLVYIKRFDSEICVFTVWFWSLLGWAIDGRSPGAGPPKKTGNSPGGGPPERGRRSAEATRTGLIDTGLGGRAPRRGP